MTCNELNIFIKNYIINDKTDTAIMLTASWGFGKSYYVQNILTPFLENNNYKCVIISVYGLKSVQEISKQIYISLRSIKIFGEKERESEFLSTGKAVGKTIGKTLLNSFSSKVGLDIANLDEKAFQQVYESIDLTGKLIVLEDIERSEIDIADILGYVNNLTEHDHVKVLLVANEKELIKIENKTDEKILYSDVTKKYLKFKEKTISDTVRFDYDQTDAITNILGEYNCLSKDFSAEGVAKQFGRLNLRTFKYACQKSNELLTYLDAFEFRNPDYLQRFRENIFYGVLKQAISLSRDYEQASKWKGGRYYYHGEEKSQVRIFNPTPQVYLIFKFCFDYLINHERPLEEYVQETYLAYSHYCLYEANQTAEDEDLSVLRAYHIHTEEDVKTAVANVSGRLKNENDIPFIEYGDLSRILLKIKHELGISIEECKKNLIKNLKGKSNIVDSEFMFVFDIKQKDTDEQREYLELKDAMISSLNDFDDCVPFGFDYNPDKIENLELEVLHRDTQKDFVSAFEIEKLKNMISKSNAKQLDDLRGLFFAAYRSGIYEERSVYYPISDKDRAVILELIDYISKNNFENFDRVQLLQLDMLKDNLSEMINSGAGNG